MDFNYQKAYCVLALPAFKELNQKQIKVHTELHGLVKDLNQGRDLNIPASGKMLMTTAILSNTEIAKLSRSSYFVGHWYPNHVEKPFANSKGESWKITNVLDQELRKRLKCPKNVEIHEGQFRVTYSSTHCWMWEEFGLATQKNLALFIEFKHNNSFKVEETFKKDAERLKKICGDTWPDVDDLVSNKVYDEFVEGKKIRKLESLAERKNKALYDLRVKEFESEIEYDAFYWLTLRDININNCIYYGHTNTFCFGWRNELTNEEKKGLTEKLVEFKYNWKFK